MSNISDNPIILLEPNSLYISTKQLLSSESGAGKFHWSLHVTNSSGIAALYHWATTPPNLNGNKAEAVQVIPKHIPSMYDSKSEWKLMLGFFKVGGFVPPPSNSEESEEEFGNIILNLGIHAFDPPDTYGYATVKENRDRGLMSRRWAMRVCEKLKEAGYIKRGDVGDIENAVRERSIVLAELVAQGKLEVSEVVTV